MRKKIEVKSEVKKSTYNEVKAEEKMQTIESVYAKMVRRISYLKDRHTTSKLLDFQDALQEVMSEVIGKVVENPKYYIRRAVSNRMKNQRREISLENFGETLEVKYSENDDGILQEVKEVVPALVVNPQGEIVTVLEAINRILTVSEKDIFNYYTQGFTCQEVAVKIGSNEKTVQRQVKKIYDKIDKLRVSYFYESKYAAYQGKVGKVNMSYQDTKYNEKLDKYFPIVHTQGEVINRQFLCLDQSKEVKKYMGTMVDRIANRKEAIVEIASALDKNKYEVKILNSQYMDSNLGPFTSNKEVIQLYYNRHEYSQMLRSEMTVVKEKRYKIEFSNSRYISTDKKYLDF